MAVEKLEIGKEYYLDLNMKCKGVYREYREVTKGSSPL